MSQKFSNTTADFLEWNQAMILIRKLFEEQKYSISLLIAIGCFFGVRISDILTFRWIDLLNKESFNLTEQKTGKPREIKINPHLKKHISACYAALKPLDAYHPIFLNKKGTVYSVQRINLILKSLKIKYRLQIKNFSTHSLRKTFGRAVFEKSGTNAELTLVKLSQIFNHSNPAITRRYLGISQEELLSTYDLLSF